MDCARCGNALHRVPMFDLPRRVKEFSCMCCGERFWMVEGNVDLFQDESVALKALKKEIPVEYSATSRHN